MYLTLRFDYSTDTLYVPDGYIGDSQVFQAGFFKWLYHNPDYILCDGKGHSVYQYDASAILDYINQEVLQSSAEKAYFTSEKQRRQGKTLILSF